MKKRLCAFLAALMLLSTVAFALPDPPESGYVLDQADVISSETTDHINSQNKALNDATGAAIVVVSVDFMDGMDSASYASQMFNEWGIGDPERNNGLLLVFAVGENKVRALQGTGLENALTSAKLETYLEDYFYDDYDAQSYDTAVLNFFDAVYGWFEDYYAGSGNGGGAVAPVQPGAGPEQYYQEYEHRARTVSRVMDVIWLIVVLVVLFVVLDGMRYNRYRRRYMGPGMPPPPVMYYPIFFGRRHHHHYHDHHDHRPPPPPGGGGFGGFGGGPFGGGGSRGGGAGR